jgi:DNA-binding IclR family transcriptional regulator
MPLHATAVGKSLLAFSPPDLLEDVLRTDLERYTRHTLVDAGRLKEALEQVRATGLAYSHQERTLGAVGVASPIQGMQGRLLRTVGIVAPVGTRTDRLGPAVRTAALTISRTLGAVPGGRPSDT